jgi:hypothetical protein
MTGGAATAACSGLPMLRDHQDADFHLALRQGRVLVEKGPDPLHAARNRRTMDPDLVGAEDAAAAGGELVEHRRLLRRQLLGRNFESSVHGALSSCDS